MSLLTRNCVLACFATAAAQVGGYRGSFTSYTREQMAEIMAQMAKAGGTAFARPPLPNQDIDALVRKDVVIQNKLSDPVPM